MIPNPFRGKFFAFEGIDGCGKSMQLEMAKLWLGKFKETPYRCFVVKTEKEPGKERLWGKNIYRELAKPNGLHTTNLYGFQSWYARDSKEHMPHTIHALELGTIVLMDRFRSSMVFGVPENITTAEGRAEAIKELMHLNQSILGEDFIWPDALFIFDVGAETAISRLKIKFHELGRGDFDEHEKASKLKVVRSNYLLFANMYPNCYVIDAEGTLEAVFEKVKAIIEPIILKMHPAV